jgi:hypothetical protein
MRAGIPDERIGEPRHRHPYEDCRISKAVDESDEREAGDCRDDIIGRASAMDEGGADEKAEGGGSGQWESVARVERPLKRPGSTLDGSGGSDQAIDSSAAARSNTSSSG